MCFGKSGHVESEKLAARPARTQQRYNYGATPNYGGKYNNRHRTNNNADLAANGLQAGVELFDHGRHHHHDSGAHHHHHHHHGHYDGGGHSGGWHSGGHDGGGHSGGGHDGGGGSSGGGDGGGGGGC